MSENHEQKRLEAHHRKEDNWRLWGPYLSERSWGNVREDYSADGEAWRYFTHDHARSRAYRWNEDGLGGISDRNQYLCFSFAFWNGQDPFLKERLFGLTGEEGNHGEDVKECYFYLDNTPTHSYMKMLYKYPQKAFPYAQLVEENKGRSLADKEFELIDTGIFDENRYFDLFIEYAKENSSDVLIKITAHNRGPEAAKLSILPTLWFRNTWSWGYPKGPMDDVSEKPQMHADSSNKQIIARHAVLGSYTLYLEDSPELVFTENETNNERLFHTSNKSPFVKDAFHRYLVNHEEGAINPAQTGTKAAAIYNLEIPAEGHQTLRLRLSSRLNESPFQEFDQIFNARQEEADAFYDHRQNPHLDSEDRKIQRQAFAGMLWSKQLYYYDVQQWEAGDPPLPRKIPPVRNSAWDHLVNFDVISMPDKWEFPWYASWDLAFHCIPLVMMDPDFAKRQLTLMTREWYMHPNGQLPAYEWNFDDVNPPVLAWAAWRVYKIDLSLTGKPDTPFLRGIFNKLLLNFTWWVNRKDIEGHNVFEGGFLGMDNISLFDRSERLPDGGHVYQSDSTSWMGFYCLLMMKISIELARTLPIYQDTATKFFEHFLRIAHAMVNCGSRGLSLWDKEDGFFYDVLHLPDNRIFHLKVRSLVGLLPLFAVETIDHKILDNMPTFRARMHWFMKKRPDLSESMACIDTPGMGERHLMSILTKERLIKLLQYMLDENEFLSPYGIRSVSKVHAEYPYELATCGQGHTISYEPGESQTRLFGGNSNWRGPIWFPINFLIIESLQKFHHYYGEDFKVECPTGSGNWMTLERVAKELSRRLIEIFRRNKKGLRPLYGKQMVLQNDPYWREYILFHEYFHGETGEGLGASHQTGWTGLVAKLIQQSVQI